MTENKKNIEAIYELSPMQQGMLFHSVYNEDSKNYFEQLSVTLKGELNPDLFRKAWEKVIQRHAVLRTSFVYKKLDRMLQIVNKKVDLPYQFLDWTRKSEADQEVEFELFLREDKNEGFNFGKVPLLRVTLIKLATNKYKLIWSYHHILIDGWSLPIIFSDLFLIYKSLEEGQQIQLPSVNQFHNYIKFLQTKNKEETNSFWETYLEGFSEKTPIIIDKDIPLNQNNEYKKHTISMDENTTSKLDKLSRENGITLSTLLQAAWAILLHKYSNNDDVVFGATFSGRPATLDGAERMVGLFINSLPIRAKIDSTENIIKWINEFSKSLAALKDHEHSALVDIQKISELPPKQNLFDSLFVFENYPVDDSLKNNNLSIEFKDFSTFERTNYPLTIVSAPGDRINIDAAFDSSEIQEFRIDLLLNHLKNILIFISSYSSKKINEIDYLTDDEKKILKPIKYINPELPKPWIVIEHFEKAVERYPDNIALRFHNEEFTYAEINRKANKLAHFLVKRGIGIEDLVGICVSRNPQMIISILAVLKVGAGYIPIDASYPADRINYILEDSKCKLLLTESLVTIKFDFPKSQIINVDSLEESLVCFPGENLNVKIHPENIIYVIYTSGSTGKPKGTVLQNKSVFNFIKDFSSSIRVTSETRVLQFASIGFDASIPEIFSPLLNGGSIQLSSKEVLSDLSKFNEFVIANRINILLLPPSVLSIIPVFSSPYLNTILSAGEKCNWKIVEKWSKNYRFINGYGPTEASVGCTWGTYSTSMNTNSVPIGIPIFNVKVYVLDKHLMPVTFGVRGELFVGEDALARGYLNKPDLTASKFIPNLYSSKPGERIYKTNDLVKILSDGQLEFVGRVDNQVKLRGFRIELEEIEAILNNKSGIVQSAVILDENEDKKIIAFIVCTNNKSFDTKKLRKELESDLPKFMIPSHFEQIDSIPLTARGKIDRKKLLRINITSLDSDVKELTIQTTTEELLCSIVKSILNINNAYSNNNFFELGGHSLSATQLASRIREAFNVEIPINIIFEKESLAALAHEIDQMQKEDYGYGIEKIGKYEKNTKLALSFSQQRMWFVQKFDKENISNNIFNGFSIKGIISIEAFEYSINEIIKRHEILRTRYYDIEGQPYQRIDDRFTYKLEVIDFTSSDQNEIEAEIDEISNSIAVKVFDLTVLPLFKIVLVKITEDDFKLFLSMHHIIADGWSVNILITELMNLYRSQLEGIKTNLFPLEIQYSDFAQWQNSWLSGDNLEKQLNYWVKELAEIPEKIELPTDRPRPAVQTFNGASFDFELDEIISMEFNALTKKMNVTPFMLAFAALNIVLKKYSSQNTILIGSPIANRNRKEIENLIGFFVNTLVLRTDFNNEDRVTDIIKQVREKTLQAYLHQDLPFEKLVDHIVKDRDLSTSPLFQVAFVFQNNINKKLEFPNVTLEPIKNRSKISKYDISIYMQERNGKLFGTIEYNTDLFDEDTIARLKNHYLNAIKSIVKNPKQKIQNLTILDELEYKRVINNWNVKEIPSLREDNVPNQFYKIASKFSSDIALTFSELDTETLYTEQLTYKELNEKSNQLARYLIRAGINREDLVGISLSRSFDLIISILGILKVGAAFIPIDPNYPNDRIKYMVEDSGIKSLIVNSWSDDTIIGAKNEIINLDDLRTKIEKESVSNIDMSIDEKNLAYVIYTSGSTGKPKGTLLNHMGLLNLSKVQKNEFNISNEKRILQFSALSFDAFVWETVMALLNGASLNLVTKEIISSSEDLTNIIKSLKISTITLPPSVLSVMPTQDAERLHDLKTIIVAGEKCSGELAQRWSVNRQFVNAYGPTETTVCASMYNYKSSLMSDPPIGRPIENFGLYVLDHNFNPVPIGVPGELFIAGVGLARGYHKLPALTSQNFLPNPFSKESGSLMYKSGDLVKYLPDGNIEFLGRIDNQVKLRGFRIELGEIEKVILNNNLVQDCLVILRDDLVGPKQLVAYIISSNNTQIDFNDLRAQLRVKLPEYMVPTFYVSLNKFPLTPSKKIDHKSLPLPNIENQVKKVEYVEPRNETEKIIGIIGEELLGINKMGVFDNFFELGGHSLLATQFVSKIKSKFNKEISLKTLFENPTIVAIAKKIDELEDETVKGEDDILKQERGEGDLLDLINKLENMSDEEAIALIEKDQDID